MEGFVEQLEFEITEDELLRLIDREMELRAAAGESIDPFEYRHRFPAHQGVMESAFSRLREFRADNSSNPQLATRQTDDKSSDVKNTDDGFFDLPVDTRPDEIPERIGVYKIGRRLGSGGFGVVHLAEDTLTGQQLALKFPRRQQIRTPEEFAGFRREADAASGLQHSGIVRTFGVFEVDGYIFIAQQYVGGGSLKALRDSSVSQRRIAEIIAQVSEALAYAHQQGITHRDLKPSNILLDADANPLIADFGLAIHDSAQRRLKGELSGTPLYMSPEQVSGLAHLLDGRSDIWSLGVIMYELLVGRRPFQGAIRDELFEEIIGRDPRPPRMIRPQIDRELQRICLKCLQKPIRERYNTADELTQDLRAWLSGQSPGISRSGTIPVVPRGLHSFGSHDSDFFQRLLPGPKDQHGLAEITRFWKSQIEMPRGHPTFRVGVIIGPSGCGKSSYVKAGLLPFLDNQRVNTLFVEATADDTEARLEQKLRAVFPALPRGIALPRMLDLVRDELRREGQRKLLIVIDQFEQWLLARPAADKTGLQQALQHTDGDNLQCILLVRDDFWLRLSQFLHDMEIDFQEGTNARRVDLFDKRHAEQVLHEFGLAFGKLPELDQELTPDQTQFLRQAIESIAEEERIVCVRLALFAEMFRNRPWTVAELSKVGGAAGIGETFLNETFASANSELFYRRHEQPVRRILGSLLPTGTEKIRGHMMTHEFLLAQSRLPRDEFNLLMNRLDTELRLVTPTDPAAIGENDLHEGDETERHFQLTHDYLVPSIRDWLTKDQQRTIRGRAELRLNELSGYWSQKQDPSFLPGWQEYALILWRVPHSVWTDSQRRFMRTASRFFMIRGFLILLAAGLLAGWGFFWNQRLRARAMHDELLSANLPQVPEIVEKMKSLRGWVNPMLLNTRQEIESRSSPEALSAGDQARLLRLNLGQVGLAGADAGLPQVEYLQGRLLDSDPEQLRVIRQMLLPHHQRILHGLWEVVDNRNGPVLQAAAGLALYDPRNPRWESCQNDVADLLVKVPTTHFPVWMSMFEPVREVLLPVLIEIHADPERSPAEKQLALELIIQYEKSDCRFLVQAIETADPDGLQAIVAEIRDRKPVALLERRLSVSAEPNWNDGNAARTVPALENATLEAIQMAGGEVHPAFAYCARMPRDSFLQVCDALQPEGYRLNCVRIVRGEDDAEHYSCV